MITIKNKRIPWHNKITISELLNKIEYGDQYAVVRLNGKLISKTNFNSTIVEDGSNVIPLPMIAGG